MTALSWVSVEARQAAEKRRPLPEIAGRETLSQGHPVAEAERILAEFSGQRLLPVVSCWA